MRWFKNWLRRKLNDPVRAEMRKHLKIALDEGDAITDWDGTPAPIVAEINTWQHALDILDSDR